MGKPANHIPVHHHRLLDAMPEKRKRLRVKKLVIRRSMLMVQVVGGKGGAKACRAGGPSSPICCSSSRDWIFPPKRSNSGELTAVVQSVVSVFEKKGINHLRLLVQTVSLPLWSHFRRLFFFSSCLPSFDCGHQRFVVVVDGGSRLERAVRLDATDAGELTS
nr:hypothetical protein Iba_chr02eCG6500 [Ipomoea batatas]